MPSILRFNYYYNGMFLQFFCREIRYKAFEYTRLLQREYQSTYDFVRFLICSKPLIIPQRLYNLAVHQQLGVTICTLDCNMFALTRTAAVIEGKQISIAAETNHAADRVGEIELSPSAPCQHRTSALVCPCYVKVNLIIISYLLQATPVCELSAGRE